MQSCKYVKCRQELRLSSTSSYNYYGNVLRNGYNPGLGPKVLETVNIFPVLIARQSTDSMKIIQFSKKLVKSLTETWASQVIYLGKLAKFRPNWMKLKRGMNTF